MNKVDHSFSYSVTPLRLETTVISYHIPGSLTIRRASGSRTSTCRLCSKRLVRLPFAAIRPVWPSPIGLVLCRTTYSWLHPFSCNREIRFCTPNQCTHWKNLERRNRECGISHQILSSPTEYRTQEDWVLRLLIWQNIIKANILALGIEPTAACCVLKSIPLSL